MAIDSAAIKEHIRGILIALGDDPDREGLKETPDRVARMYQEVFEGMNYTNDEIAQMFGKVFFEDTTDKGTNDIVLVKDIEIFSYCEHHMALMYDMKVSVAYTPADKVIGLSKIARIAEMVGKRLQIQERIGSDIAEIISKVTGSANVAVMIEGCHSCMTARGVKKPGSKTYTATMRGRFDTDPALLNKLMMMVNHQEEKTMAKHNKAVVVFSGGQDSTTCLFWAMKKYDEVIAISFDYGQRHVLELECAKAIAKKYGVEHHILDMSLLGQLAPNSLTRTDMEVDHDAPEEGTPNTFVDGRNMIFLTFAAVFAKQRDIHVLVTGVSQSDFSGYPDCRDVFIKSLNASLTLAMDYEFDIMTPMMWIDKKETWAMADELGVLDIIRNETLTCYNGVFGDGCGDCPSCKLRRRGLEQYLATK